VARAPQVRFLLTAGAGAVRNISPTAGAGTTVTTKAAFAAAGVITTIRWSGAVSVSAAATIPAAPSTAVAGVGWRDVTAESVEPITYAAGTWTLTFDVNKDGQGALPTDVTVRITAIVYEVTTSGAFVKEIGRMVTADTVIAGAAVDVAASFTTASPTTILAGSKIQTEIVVQPLVAGLPAAPATAVNIILNLDGTAAQTPTRFTAVPQFTIQYARSTPDTAPAADGLVRKFTGTRSTADTAPAADSLVERATYPRATADTAPAADALSRRTTQARSVPDAAPATDAIIRRTTQARSLADTAPAADALTRRTTQARSTADTAPAADALTRTTFRPRATADNAPAADTVARQTVQARSTSDTAPAVDALTRILTQVRALADSAPASDTLSRLVTFLRSTADTAPATDALARTAFRFRSLADSAPAIDSLTRILIQVRATSDNIGPSGTGGGGEAPVTPADIAAIADAVWNELTAEARAAGSYGATVAARLDAAVSSRSTPADVTAARDVVTAAVGSPAQVAALAAVQSAVNALGSPAQANAYTPARAALLDALARLDVAVSSRATPADVLVTVSPGPTGTVS